MVPYRTAVLHLPIIFKLAERAFQKCMGRLCSENSEYPKSAFLGRFTGPVFASATASGASVTVSFSNVGEGSMVMSPTAQCNIIAAGRGGHVNPGTADCCSAVPRGEIHPEFAMSLGISRNARLIQADS